ncbi:MAG: substrate-binding domain-containing protein [Methanobacterium sp.]
MKDRTTVIITILIVLIAGIGVYAESFLNSSKPGSDMPAFREVVLNDPQGTGNNSTNGTGNITGNTSQTGTRNITETTNRTGITNKPQSGTGTGPGEARKDTNNVPKRTLKISTTTSLYDTKLLDEIESAFEKKYPVDVHIIAAGTGIAIGHGEKGDVDLLLVHDKTREENFVKAGFGTRRTEFAYNHFWVVGPADDPAGIKGPSATSGFKKIAEEGNKTPDRVKFVSRGDTSGTHSREIRIWGLAGVNHTSIRNATLWYRESGTGMGTTLTIADNLKAYTLTDSGTFLAFSKGDKIRLVPLVTTGSDLLNVYTAIPVNPQKHSHTNIEDAENFVSFLISTQGQGIIGNFGKDKFGEPLFTPI